MYFSETQAEKVLHYKNHRLYWDKKENLVLEYANFTNERGAQDSKKYKKVIGYLHEYISSAEVQVTNTEEVLHAAIDSVEQVGHLVAVVVLRLKDTAANRRRWAHVVKNTHALDNGRNRSGIRVDVHRS